jgi:tRNA 2-thiocytidine biosynthesis protein TtcA
LAQNRRALGVPYTLEALHISSDFCACCKKGMLQSRLAQWDIPFSDHFVPVIGRLKPGRKMNCYWCSTQRRTELLKWAVERGFTKIALGHHLDDLLETFFMNLSRRGELAAMPLMLPYRKYPVTLIRPLGYVEEAQVIAAAEELDILRAACTCPYGRNSPRRSTRTAIDTLTNGSGDAKRRILRAIQVLGPAPR